MNWNYPYFISQRWANLNGLWRNFKSVIPVGPIPKCINFACPSWATQSINANFGCWKLRFITFDWDHLPFWRLSIITSYFLLWWDKKWQSLRIIDVFRVYFKFTLSFEGFLQLLWSLIKVREKVVVTVLLVRPPDWLQAFLLF